MNKTTAPAQFGTFQGCSACFCVGPSTDRKEKSVKCCKNFKHGSRCKKCPKKKK